MTGDMKLSFPSGMFRGIWVYVNGKPIVEDPDTLVWERAYESGVFKTTRDEELDIRILVYTRDSLGPRGAGFSDGIYLQNV
jgi:hypothetical protein